MMKISVVINSYNYARYIGRAIRSCLDQSYSREHFEILVVDDASEDYSQEVLKSFGSYIRVLYLEKNVGLAAARNAGIRAALGQFVVCLDADDYFHQDFLKVCMLNLTFNSDNMDAVATDYYLVNDNEEFIKRVNYNSKPIACGVLYKKDHLVDIGLYDPELGIGEDVDFRIRFQQRYRIGRVALPLYRYRMHSSNMTRDTKQNVKGLNIIKEKHGLSSLASPYIRDSISSVKGDDLLNGSRTNQKLLPEYE